MRKIILISVFTVLFSIDGILAQKLAESGDDYRLKKIISVAGRQGIAVDYQYYYVSSSTALYKYTKDGQLVLKNENPFVGLEKEANHFGDIDVHENKIYTGIEWFEDGVGKDIQIAIYNAETLEYESSINFDAESGQIEVSGITVDKQRNMAWMSDWVEGKYLYRYDLNTGKYSGKVYLKPSPQWQQGVFYVDGKILITADDGNADFHEMDNIYIADVVDMERATTHVKLFKECKEFLRAGEIEGISMDPKNNDLIVLSNRGSRISLGMVKGFYPGYYEELHELYIYERIN